MAGIVGTITNLSDFLSKTQVCLSVKPNDPQQQIICLEADRKYSIPAFQREVRWDDNNLKMLLYDLSRSSKFLGNIILTIKSDHTCEIIDGQQRTTVLMFVLQGGERMKYKLLKDLYDCFCTPPELQAQKQEIEECHQALSKVLGKLERRLVLQIIDAKDRIAEETSIDSFIAGFELAWKLSVELNHYENERSVSCQTAMGSGARFAFKEEEK